MLLFHKCTHVNMSVLTVINLQEQRPQRIIIATSIIAGIPSAIGKLFNFVQIGELNIITIILFLIIMLAILYSIVFVERSFRKIPIQYPQRTKGRKVFAGQASHLPLKINAAGVIPPIFASSIFPLFDKYVEYK